MSWITENIELLASTLSAAEVQAELAARGVTKSRNSIVNARSRHGIDNDRHRRARALLRLATPLVYGSKQLFRSSKPYLAVDDAIRDGLAKRVGKSTYRLTLAGIAWLVENVGPDWETRVRP